MEKPRSCILGGVPGVSNNKHTVNPLLTPLPPSNKPPVSNKPPFFRGRKLISPPSLLSPPPPYYDRLYKSILIVKLRVD